MKIMKVTVPIIFFVASIAVAYALGWRMGERKAFAQSQILMNGAQADLLFNRIVDEREMVSMLSKGCIPQTRRHLSIDVDQDTALLAEFYRGPLDPQSVSYIVEHDPGLLKSLATFKSKYGKSWMEAACAP